MPACLSACVCCCAQALILFGSSNWAARLWGVSAGSPLWEASSQFLSIRALGAPVTVLLLVMQVGYGRLSADLCVEFQLLS